MKNLKKILMAFVLVALLISSAAIIAIAEASYTGSVDEARALLDVFSSLNKRTIKTITKSIYAQLSPLHITK